MGVVAGGPLILLGRRWFPGWSLVRPVLEADLVLLLTAMVAGGAALARAYLTLDAEHLPAFWIPPEAVDSAAFSRASELHNASYLGGLFGVLTGSAWLAFRSRCTSAKRR